MSSYGWTLLTVLAIVLTQGKCETTAFPAIPEHLLECYRNQAIYHRANRMPSSLDYFLDLVRKVEDGPTSRNMNARELSLALLYYLKLDGIQSTRPNTKYYPSTILPFATSGAEYFKHRLTLVGLIPRIDRDYLTAFNETLTKREMCNLHFMLSYSIDPYKREDEKCSPLFEETRRWPGAESKSTWNPHPDIGRYYGRNRRHISRGENVNELGEEKRKILLSGKLFDETYSRVSEDAIGDEISRSSGELTDIYPRRSDDNDDPNAFTRFSRRRRSVGEERDRKSEVEEIAVPKHPNAREEKDKFTIGDQELLSAGEDYPRRGLQSLVQVGNFGRYGGRTFPMYSTDESSIAGVIPGIPLSDCPVVNGVITTPFGSLTTGTVIAGIAAGLNPEDIPPQKLSVDPKELESPLDRVKNVWATTLAGTVADTISSAALLEDALQILKGGWNDSTDPKWYLLNSNKFQHLSEVALRGSLDGLLLGVNAKEWTGRYPGFKLSQMLQTYYDCCWGEVGAKNRVQLRPKYAPDEIFRKQVHLMSLVLKKQKTNVLTVLDYNQVSREAVSKVVQHIQTMDDREKSFIGSFSPTKNSKEIENSINMLAVIDSSWGQENLLKFFEILRSARVANYMGNNVTMICGKDGRVLFSYNNIADFNSQFTKEMLMENCTRGLDLPLVFDTLDVYYRKIFYDEKIQQKMNTDSQVVVLFPYEPALQENSYLVEKSRNFRNNFPGVRLVVASNGKSEGYLPLLESAKDLFPLVSCMYDPDLKYPKDLAEGLKQSYQRISRPSCGSYFDDETPGSEIRVTRDVGIGNIVYYRLLPNYFYTQHEQATVTITSKQRAPLTVCHSRDNEKPRSPRDFDWTPRGGSGIDHSQNGSPEYNSGFPPEASPYGRQVTDQTEEAVQCKTITSDAYRIELNNPCEGASGLKECRPLYISLFPPRQETVSITCPTCKLPSNVQYEIAVTGLTCYNNATQKLLSSFLIGLLFIFYSLKHFC